MLASISRLQGELLTPEQVRAAGLARETLAVYREREDLVSIGAYAVGSDPKVDYAIAKKPDIDRFLQQSMAERSTAPEARAQLELLMGDAPPVF